MISEIKKKQINEMHEKGFIYQKICKTLMIPKSTIQSILSPTYIKSGFARGPKRKLTQRIAKSIKRTIKRINVSKEIVTAAKILKRSRFDASLSTIRRHLRSNGLKYKNVKPKIVFIVQNYINLTQHEMIMRLYDSFLARYIIYIETEGNIVK